MAKIIKIFPTPQELAESLASEIMGMINVANKKKSLISIALSGGSTPNLFFSILGDKYAGSVNWKHVHFFWVDERCVPPDDKESNFRMTSETLFSKIRIPVENIHRIKGEADPDMEAWRYSGEIIDHVKKKNGLPFFDLILLGLGEDGHTASIFPGNEKLFLSDQISATAVHPVTGQKRITITGKVINNSEQVFFMVTGKGKALIVKKIIDEGDPEKQFPASYVLPADANLSWYLDAEAGSLLKPESLTE